MEGVRRALGRAEVSVIEVQQNMYDLRVAIGGADEEGQERRSESGNIPG
ncbi:hypothetical protein [Streptomyces sp. MMS24-I29]